MQLSPLPEGRSTVEALPGKLGQGMTKKRQGQSCWHWRPPMAQVFHQLRIYGSGPAASNVSDELLSLHLPLGLTKLCANPVLGSGDTHTYMYNTYNYKRVCIMFLYNFMLIPTLSAAPASAVSSAPSLTKHQENRVKSRIVALRSLVCLFPSFSFVDPAWGK